MSYDDDRMMADTAAIAARAKPAAPSPALTREALIAAVHAVAVEDETECGDELIRHAEAWTDAILAALGTPPPPPTSTREENL